MVTDVGAAMRLRDGYHNGSKPPMTNQFIAIIKNTALVSTPGVHLSILIVSALGRVQRWIVNA